MDKKPQCEYGSKCYRKSQEHLEKYHHDRLKKNFVDKDRPRSKERQNAPKEKLRQTTLNFYKGKPQNNEEASEGSNTKMLGVAPKRKRSCSSSTGNPDKIICDCSRRRSQDSDKKNCDCNPVSVVDFEDNDSSVGDVTASSWTFSKNDDSVDNWSCNVSESEKEIIETHCKTVEDRIKYLFLVQMPPDFYSFYEFCENQNGKNPNQAFLSFGLQLVGPFDVLTGDLDPTIVPRKRSLRHWRFFMDPPEMQTVLVADATHYGYWRDEPTTKETFIVSNTIPDYKIKMVAPNIFGVVVIHMDAFIRQSSPFEKVKANKVLSALKQWADDRGFDLSDSSPYMKNRKKKVVAPTFNEIGIVVDVDPKTEVGYRPLLEKNASLKKILEGVIDADTDAERDIKMEKVDELVNAANIANDECDFGNGLELGIDLFCMGSDLFNDKIEHLLYTAYLLLKRPEWGEVIKAHLGNRRTGRNLSVLPRKN